VNKSENFSTLGELLFTQKEDKATLGAAIEKYGIHTMGRDGCLTQYPIDSEQALQALVFLTTSVVDGNPMKVKYFQAFEDSRYGWPIAVLPDFESIRFENERKITTLNHLLNRKDPIPHAGLACEIECDGVYGFDRNQNPRHFGPDSAEAQDALTGISVHLKHERVPPPPGYEEWYMEEDPTYQYGWLKDDLPNFRQTEEYSWVESFHRLESRGALFKDDIYTIGRILLMRKGKPGSIRTAIDRGGVYGFDGMGRVTYYDADDKELGELDAALEQYAQVLLRGLEPELSLIEAAACVRFGWPKMRLPDFAAIEAEPVPEPSMAVSAAATSSAVPTVAAASTGREVTLGDGSEELSARARKPYELLILGLLCVLRGEFPGSKDPEFDTDNQEKLAEFLTKQIGVHGAGVRSIKQKFSAANKLRSEVGLPELIRAKTVTPPSKS